MKRISLSLLCLIAAIYVRATSIVVLIYENIIVMGADTKEIFFAGNKKIESSVCKIGKFKNFFFTGAGKVKSSYTDYSLFSIIPSALAKSSTAQVDTALVAKTLKDALEQQILKDKQNDSSTYKRDKKSGLLLEMCIAGLVNNVPTVYDFVFTFQDGSSDKIKYRAKTISAQKGKTVPLFYGLQSETKKYINADRILTLNPLDLVDNAIKAQIKKSKEFVGGPVQLLGISNDFPGGFRWDKQSTTCIK